MLALLPPRLCADDGLLGGTGDTAIFPLAYCNKQTSANARADIGCVSTPAGIVDDKGGRATKEGSSGRSSTQCPYVTIDKIAKAFIISLATSSLGQTRPTHERGIEGDEEQKMRLN